MVLAIGLACSREAADAPSPPRYRWPERFVYRVEFVSSTQQGGRELMRYQESRALHFDVREDESYLVYPDSTIRESSDMGGPFGLLEPGAFDTLAWYLRLGPLGEIREAEIACDPAADPCRRVMPSTLPLQLRRVVPRLSEWPVPRGSSWTDTLEFNDTGRPGGTRGILVTAYRAARDTVLGGRSYWAVTWHSLLRSYLPAAGAAIAEQRPVEEDGVTLVDKALLLPAFSAWAGTTVFGAGDSAGARLAAGFRGRAYLAGSPFDAPGALP